MQDLIAIVAETDRTIRVVDDGAVSAVDCERGDGGARREVLNVAVAADDSAARASTIQDGHNAEPLASADPGSRSASPSPRSSHVAAAGVVELMTVDFSRWFDEFQHWAAVSRTTSPIFVYFLTPIQDAVQAAFDQVVFLLNRMTWLGFVTALQ